METKKQLFINGDLINDFYDGYFTLRNQKSIETLIHQYGSLHNGLKIWLYSISYQDKKPTVVVFPGEIRDLESNNECKIYVNEKDIVKLTESQFKEYSIEDVIGSKQFNSI